MGNGMPTPALFITAKHRCRRGGVGGKLDVGEAREDGVDSMVRLPTLDTIPPALRSLLRARVSSVCQQFINTHTFVLRSPNTLRLFYIHCPGKCPTSINDGPLLSVLNTAHNARDHLGVDNLLAPEVFVVVDVQGSVGRCHWACMDLSEHQRAWRYTCGIRVHGCYVDHQELQ